MPERQERPPYSFRNLRGTGNIGDSNGPVFYLGDTMAEKKPNTPKVRYNDHTYEIVGVSGDTIRVKDSFVEFCVLAKKTKPVNKESRELFKRFM